MARLVSWLPRLHEIRRSVWISVRSAYSRAELESLFGLQPRAAGNLLRMLPRTRLAGADVVLREDLLAFLDQVQAAGDVAATIAETRAAAAPASRKALRSLIPRDELPTSLTALPAGISLARGQLGLRFASTEELVTQLWCLANVLQDEAETTRFAALYEPERPDAIALAAEAQLVRKKILALKSP